MQTQIERITDKKGYCLRPSRLVNNRPVCFTDRRKYPNCTYTWAYWYDSVSNEWYSLGDPFPALNPSNKSINDAIELQLSTFNGIQNF